MFLGFGVLKHFELKKSDKKMVTIHKDFELYQTFIYNLLSNCCNIHNIYIIYKNKLTFWCRDISST